MRLIVMFDLPTLTEENRRDYRQFRKALISSGFIMMQESIYVRITTNKQSAKLLENQLQKIAPSAGVIQTLMVTEKQYASMNFLVGESKKDIRNSAGRLIVI
ncbi:CRISPR-associated endonuclease Cas2 [Agrilactobacillus yilanensis]|uniref:CRISPR-associated endoribonuclease Cas2 n=1 Tax=Agrilactobacillus yilanensis TaxID=2485997 RepID=A0ABW4J9Q4_9LACO|nr:CRISPR-associated endonuclease Cas2 [Agrilactobacillus yilanensis]